VVVDMLLSRLLTYLLVTAIQAYQQRLSPFLPHMCRHKTSCSEYMRQAILYHGVIKGCCLGLMRLLRCHPFSKGGQDEIPLLYYSYFVNRSPPIQVDLPEVPGRHNKDIHATTSALRVPVAR